MKVRSESQDILTRVSTNLEGRDSLIVKGNFYQRHINELHKIYIRVSVVFIFIKLTQQFNPQSSISNQKILTEKIV